MNPKRTATRRFRAIAAGAAAQPEPMRSALRGHQLHKAGRILVFFLGCPATRMDGAMGSGEQDREDARPVARLVRAIAGRLLVAYVGLELAEAIE